MGQSVENFNSQLKLKKKSSCREERKSSQIRTLQDVTLLCTCTTTTNHHPIQSSLQLHPHLHNRHFNLIISAEPKDLVLIIAGR